MIKREIQLKRPVYFGTSEAYFSVAYKDAEIVVVPYVNASLLGCDELGFSCAYIDYGVFCGKGISSFQTDEIFGDPLDTSNESVFVLGGSCIADEVPWVEAEFLAQSASFYLIEQSHVSKNPWFLNDTPIVSSNIDKEPLARFFSDAYLQELVAFLKKQPQV